MASFGPQEISGKSNSPSWVKNPSLQIFFCTDKGHQPPTRNMFLMCFSMFWSTGTPQKNFGTLIHHCWLHLPAQLHWKFFFLSQIKIKSSNQRLNTGWSTWKRKLALQKGICQSIKDIKNSMVKGWTRLKILVIFLDFISTLRSAAQLKRMIPA